MSQKVFILLRIPSDGTVFNGSDIISLQPAVPVAGVAPSQAEANQAAVGRKMTQPSVSTAFLTSEDSSDMAELTFKSPVAVRVSLLLSKLGVTHACWLTSSCGRFYEVHLTYEGGFKCERLVYEMNAMGVGTTQGSSINCLPISLHSSIRAQFSIPAAAAPAPRQLQLSNPLAAGISSGPQSQNQQIMSAGNNPEHLDPGHGSDNIADLQQRRPTSDSIQNFPRNEQIFRVPLDPQLAESNEYMHPCESDNLVGGSPDARELALIKRVHDEDHKSYPPTIAKRSKIKDFMKTIRSRLTVQEVLSVITESTAITFDYICLGLLASIISAVGLIINSSVVIVASMLISPLMGPILAIVFAIVIRDFNLLKKGIRAELLGSTICLVVGFAIGIIDAIPRIDQPIAADYPTEEMCTRGQYISLLTGIFIALPSGAGVAISVLGGNVGSLVGVAISASLLPPAVNCGILYGYATVAAIAFKQHNIQPNMTRNEFCVIRKNRSVYGATPATIAQLSATAGTVSLLLTLLNIVCIIFMGFIVLKIKQVAPISTFSDTFWKEDVKTAKEYYQTIEREDATRMKEQYLKYLKEYLEVDAEPNEQNECKEDKISRIAENLTTINKDLDMISRSVYRFGGASNTREIIPDISSQISAVLSGPKSYHSLRDDECYPLRERHTRDVEDDDPRQAKDRFHVVEVRDSKQN